MGIRGLTTFINNRSELYLESYKLHDSSIVIDGNSIACQLYKWHCQCNDCFGGDYDRFANVVVHFFQLLSESKVVPYVILDGGYEERKLATVISRMKKKIKSAEQLNPVTDRSISVFPLFLRETFVEVMLKLNINVARSDFECDTEIASLAKCLDCPVLSYDSDFFIFDVPYIPFSTFEMLARKRALTKNSKQFYSYIACKIYKIDNFLNSFGGLDKSKLPLLAVVMGNDYVNRSAFALFFDNLKRQKCRGQSEQQKRIKSVIVWLQNETITSAVKKIITRYKLENRQKVLDKIQNAIKGYYYVNSPLFHYFNVKPTFLNTECHLPEISIEELLQEDSVDNVESSEEEHSEHVSDLEDLISDQVADNQDIKRQYILPELFNVNFRKCVYPPCFMDIIRRNKYYCIPQIEDSSAEYAHKVSSEIIMTIHKILTGNRANTLTVYARNECNGVQKYGLPVCDVKVPTLSDIENINLEDCKITMIKMLGVSAEFKEMLKLVPASIHLFLISLEYFGSKTKVNMSTVYALVLSFLVLYYIDRKVGFFRSAKTLEKKYLLEIQKITSVRTSFNVQYCADCIFQPIDYEDSLLCLQKVIPFFQVDLKMKSNAKLFDRQLVHEMSQFQSIFLHIKYLNSLLQNPFENIPVAEVFNGTFVYNMSKNFGKRSNLFQYVELFLKDCPTVLSTLQFIVHSIGQNCGDKVLNTSVSSRSSRKRKKRKNKTQITSGSCEESATADYVLQEEIFDPNNKFSLLSSLSKMGEPKQSEMAAMILRRDPVFGTYILHPDYSDYTRRMALCSPITDMDIVS